ncbi:MAG: hypothetical protein ACOVO9_09690 [Bacteroidia bacterium]
MKASQFIEKIEQIKPTRASLIEMEFSEKFINDVLSSFEFESLSIINKSEFDDEILELISTFNLANLKIGMIRFNNEIFIKNNRCYFGRNEADILAIDMLSKEIILIDHEDENLILQICAKDGGSFLDALFEMKFFLTQCAFNLNFNCEQEDKCSKALHCSILAGGEKYIDFYKNTLGCWS